MIFYLSPRLTFVVISWSDSLKPNLVPMEWSKVDSIPIHPEMASPGRFHGLLPSSAILWAMNRLQFFRREQTIWEVATTLLEVVENPGVETAGTPYQLRSH